MATTSAPGSIPAYVLQRERPMPDSKKGAREARRIGKAAGNRTPLPGEAALSEALAGFAARPDKAAGSGGDASSANGPGPAAPAPKTVAQVLGEITWLMTQSPRHKAIPLGDLEWLV